MPKLTDSAIRNQTPNTTLWDPDLRGFGCRAGKSSKTFVVLVASGRRFKLGRYPILSLAKAREEARNRLAQKQLGAEHRPIAFKDLKARFLADRLGNVRQRTYDSYEWLLGRVDLKGNAAEITTRTITHATDKLPPSVKHHVTAVLKMVFRFAITEGLLKTNPAEAITVRKSKARKRVLTDEELRKVWHACPGTAFGTVVKLLILTGQRRNEVQHFKLKGDLVTIAGQFTKNHRDHTFPVTGITLKLIAQDRTWGGWSKSKKDLDKASGVTGYTLHDLRRTWRTKWAALRLPREVGEKYINHVSGIQDPVEQVYDQFDYIEPMREGIAVHTAAITKIVTSPPT